jgi:hypothetical protein
MKKNRPYAVCIPLNGIILKKVRYLLNKVELNFTVDFIKKKNSRPHINLFSGTTDNITKIITVLKQNLISKNLDNKIKIFGYGAFLKKFPLIYIRFENSNYLKFIRKILFNKKKYWKKIDKITYKSQWIPKSTLFYRDLNIKNFYKIMKYLNKSKLPNKMSINELTIVDYSSSKEKEVGSIKF